MLNTRCFQVIGLIIKYLEIEFLNIEAEINDLHKQLNAFSDFQDVVLEEGTLSQ